MAKFSPGDVVLVRFPFADSMQYKIRPALVVYEDSTNEYLVCQITRKNKSNTNDGYWVAKDSKNGRAMGLETDSFLNLEVSIILRADFFFIKRIGHCPQKILEKVEEYFEL